MTGRKLGVHTQKVPGWATRWRVKAVNWFPPGTEVGRVYVPDNLSNEWVRLGADGADYFFNQVFPEMDKARGLVQAWEGANESPIWEQTTLTAWPAFWKRLTKLYHEHGFKIVGGSINTGWPTREQMPYIVDALQGCDYVGLHEYDPESLWSGNKRAMLHYRKVHEWWGGPHPPFYITECGLDRVHPTDGHWGWKSILDNNWQLYADQLTWYEMKLREDDYVQAAFIFTAGPEVDKEKPKQWLDFEVTEEIMNRVAELTPLDPNPGPDPGPLPEEGDMKVDERIKDFLTLDLTGTEYKLTEVQWMNEVESHGLHHIFIDIIDESGKRLVGERIVQTWATGKASGFIEAKPGEPWGGNFPMSATLGSYGAWAGNERAKSDYVWGMGLGTPEHPHNTIHTSFGLRFIKVSSPMPVHKLTVNQDGEGIVVVDPEQGDYAHGEQIMLNAIPECGWWFARWEGDLSGSNPHATLTMDKDKSVMAVFIEDEPVPPDEWRILVESALEDVLAAEAKLKQALEIGP